MHPSLKFQDVLNIFIKITHQKNSTKMAKEKNSEPGTSVISCFVQGCQSSSSANSGGAKHQ